MIAQDHRSEDEVQPAAEKDKKEKEKKAGYREKTWEIRVGFYVKRRFQRKDAVAPPVEETRKATLALVGEPQAQAMAFKAAPQPPLPSPAPPPPPPTGGQTADTTYEVGTVFCITGSDTGGGPA